jgi:carbon storage regulator CsrA
MLIITRKKRQKIIIANNIEITILEIGSKKVRFGIQAPSDVRIQTKLKTGKEDKSSHRSGEGGQNNQDK